MAACMSAPRIHVKSMWTGLALWLRHSASASLRAYSAAAEARAMAASRSASAASRCSSAESLAVDREEGIARLQPLLSLSRSSLSRTLAWKGMLEALGYLEYLQDIFCVCHDINS